MTLNLEIKNISTKKFFLCVFIDFSSELNTNNKQKTF